MGLDDQLNELLADLGVELEQMPETPPLEESPAQDESLYDEEQEIEWSTVDSEPALGELIARLAVASDLSLFQSSREHYGVFYRLDLVEDVPQLRVFVPDDVGPVKMRCYAVRAAVAGPLRTWFTSTNAHSGSEAYGATLEATRQHLLFAAGELMKRLFWSGDLDNMRYPDEIDVLRLL